MGDQQMDVLDLLDRLDEIEILFEPIFSADEHVIVAYEVIGQLMKDDQHFNIVEFTYDETVPADIRAEVELIMIKKAIEISTDALQETNLYIPCNPNLLMMDFGEAYFKMLTDMVEESLLPHIYLEMPMQKFNGDLDQFRHPIYYIKTYGVKTVIADIGPDSNLDQILLLEPSVLKMEVSGLDYDAWGAQNHMFATIQSIAVKMGAAFMFDNIKTSYELHYAWKNGARYFKGSYLEKPSKQFIDRDILKMRFRSECQQFISTEKKILALKYEEMNNLQKNITSMVKQINPTSANVESLIKLAEGLEEYAFRLYICNDEGFQTSPNIVRLKNVWNIEEEAIGKNWSWRPYFLLNIIKLRNNSKGDLSSIYSDIQTGELTRTYSMALNDEEFLFVDITYSYLTKHNIVN
ncbi:EAL-associated domain-containing protein [Rummeliibacillus suwonensis]|uniref:EAL-associated domain-containing protein n=1 Tax=Rummeliibacillus suwonensis TaxID=1306154 RepID=UPI001FB8B289|nr:EAL-associated domain-containing protein [Rummeliibacillus suwonensis]